MSTIASHSRLNLFLADHTNGRAIGKVLRMLSSVCRL